MSLSLCLSLCISLCLSLSLSLSFLLPSFASRPPLIRLHDSCRRSHSLWLSPYISFSPSSLSRSPHPSSQFPIHSRSPCPSLCLTLQYVFLPLPVHLDSIISFPRSHSRFPSVSHSLSLFLTFSLLFPPLPPLSSCSLPHPFSLI